MVLRPSQKVFATVLAHLIWSIHNWSINTQSYRCSLILLESLRHMGKEHATMATLVLGDTVRARPGAGRCSRQQRRYVVAERGRYGGDIMEIEWRSWTSGVQAIKRSSCQRWVVAGSRFARYRRHLPARHTVAMMRHGCTRIWAALSPWRDRAADGIALKGDNYVRPYRTIPADWHAAISTIRPFRNNGQMTLLYLHTCQHYGNMVFGNHARFQMPSRHTHHRHDDITLERSFSRP